MPPKVKPVAAGSKKTEAKKKEKIIEDKTFGLKNKKGAKQQKFIQQVQHQVKSGGARKADELKKEPTKKEEQKKEAAELNQLFKPVTTQKVQKGTDPKSVLCAFYKQGHCGKGDKCKFSHDLSLERKAEKRSVYVDMRDDGDNMENWDEAKLKEVVEKKHAEADSKLKTEIICKFFLDALERNKYGWFWECPNGERCIYRHALPPGFVLNKDRKRDDKKDEISIEDLVERERAALGGNLTKITLETFIAWKKKKILDKEMNRQKDDARKKAEFKAGKSVGLSGREMFTFNPEMATEDQTEEEGEMAYDTSNLPRDDDETDPQIIRELTLESLSLVAQESDGTGTISVSSQRVAELYTNNANGRADTIEGAIGGDDQMSTNHVEEIDVPIDENLFIDDDDDVDIDEDDEDDMDNVDS